MGDTEFYVVILIQFQQFVRERRVKRQLSIMGAVVAVVLALVANPLFGYSAPASAWDQGDVFVGVGGGAYEVYSSDGFLKDVVNNSVGGVARGCAVDAAGDLYATNYTNSLVAKLAGAHPHDNMQTLDVLAPGGSRPESVVFAANGDFFVGVAGGNMDIQRYNAAGVLQGTYDVATENEGSNRVDLAADQQTIFYTSKGRRIMRYNVATGTQLPDFAVLPDDGGQAYALRVLPPGDGTGGVLVADYLNVKLLDATGNVVQTYGDAYDSGWFAVNLDPNGTSFWSGSFQSGSFYRFNLETGDLEIGPIGLDIGPNTFQGMCVLGERTAAQLPVPPTSTPTFTSTPVPPTATETATETPVPPTSTPTNTPAAPTNTPSAPTNTPSAPTNTPVPPSATNTPVPPTRTQTQVVGTATRTRTSTRTSTPTRTPTPCSVCNLYVADVSISCNPDGTVHWTAVVRNNSTCFVTSGWKTTLQTQKNWGGFRNGQQQTGSVRFAPGDTVVSGDMCQVFAANTTSIRTEFELNTGNRRCNASMISEMIAPCPRTQPCR